MPSFGMSPRMYYRQTRHKGLEAGRQVSRKGGFADPVLLAAMPIDVKANSILDRRHNASGPCCRIGRNPAQDDDTWSGKGSVYEREHGDSQTVDSTLDLLWQLNGNRI